MYSTSEKKNSFYLNSNTSLDESLGSNNDKSNFGNHNSHLNINARMPNNKVKYSDEEISLIRTILRSSVICLQRRSLQISAKWSCEQLMGMVPEDDLEIECLNDTELYDKHRILSDNDEVSKQERDAVLFGTTLVARGDYARCAHLLRKFSVGGKGPNNNQNIFRMKSSLGMFLATYSLYMAGEKLKEQEIAESNNINNTKNQVSGNKKDISKESIEIILSLSNDSAKNPYLGDIYKELYPIYLDSISSNKTTDGCEMDGFLMYIFAIVVRDLRKQGGSIGGMPFELIETGYESCLGNISDRVVIPPTKVLLMKSVTLYPCNWSAWLELAEECTGTDIELNENISNNEDKFESSIPSWEEFNMCDITDDNYDNDISNQNLNSDIEEESDDDDDDKFNITNISNRYNNQSNRTKDKSNITKTFTKIMYLCFLVHVHLEKHQGDESLLLLQEGSEISSLFPTSQITLIQGALSFYSLRDYDRSQDVFEQARDSDPHRLEHIDTYSHILYVKERKAELSHLAHAVSKADKYSPESCCVVGNYYSLRGSHERAILYFQRALRLNCKNLSVWTLMGHEFIELHNTAAAVQCYRKAVDASSKDYRAWYGLGQTYEMLHLYQYALYYYKKAVSLKPGDARMWCAVGNCLSRLGSRKDAILALERAVISGDREGIATRELARLYREAGQSGKAAECYHKHLQSLGILLGKNIGNNENKGESNVDNPIDIDSEKAEGLLFLACYHRTINDIKSAKEYCVLLVDYVGPEGDEARAMLREIRSMVELQSLNESNHMNSPDLSSKYHTNESFYSSDRSQSNRFGGGLDQSLSLSMSSDNHIRVLDTLNDEDEE